MPSFVTKTFGGLPQGYYFRQVFFGVLLSLFILGMLNAGSKPIGAPLLLLMPLAANTFLYPYSRYMYEKIVGFIIGRNNFLVNGGIMLLFKFMTMAVCFGGAVLIAPFGLAYLYFQNSK